MFYAVPVTECTQGGENVPHNVRETEMQYLP